MLRELETRTGVPGGFIESDLVDPRYFGKANIENRMQSYLQMLEARRQGATHEVRDRHRPGLDDHQGRAPRRARVGSSARASPTAGATTRWPARSRARRRSSSARFTLLDRALRQLGPAPNVRRGAHRPAPEDAFRLELYLDELHGAAAREILRCLERRRPPRGRLTGLGGATDRTHGAAAPALFAGERRSDFFRDLAGAAFMAGAEEIAAAARCPFERLAGLFDRAILTSRPAAAAAVRRACSAAPRGGLASAAPRRRSWRPRLEAARRAADRPDRRAGLRRHRLRPPDAPLPQGGDPQRDPLPRPRRARFSRDPHGARHRRPGHQGDPGRRRWGGDLVPDERPLRRRLRALPGLHRRRAGARPPRARAAGAPRAEGGARQLDLHGVRRRRAARAAGPRRAPRGHPGGAAPGDDAARHVAARPLGRRPRQFTFTGGVCKNPMATKVLHELVADELRR
jgi:hypothetical protein